MMNARKEVKGPRQDEGLGVKVQGVFADNLLRHALAETSAKWLEENLARDSKDTLFCVTKALATKLGKARMVTCVGNLVNANRQILDKVRMEESQRQPDNEWERYPKEAIEAVWTSLGPSLQDAIRTQRRKTAPKATDDDLKAAAYELVKEIHGRTRAWRMD